MNDCSCFDAPEWFDSTCPLHGPAVVAVMRRAGDTTELGDVDANGWVYISASAHKSELAV